MKLCALIFVLLLPVPAKANSIRRAYEWCKNRLIADDPDPYAEHSTERLLELYADRHDEKVGRELVYRYQSSHLSYAEAQELFDLINSR